MKTGGAGTELVGWEQVSPEGRMRKVQEWGRMVAKAISEEKEIWSYSDGSKIGDGAEAIGSYAWCIVVQGELSEPLIHGRGIVHGEPTDISSTRAERMGVLAALTGIQLIREWAQEMHITLPSMEGGIRHVHRLDNKGAVDSANGRWDLGDECDVSQEEADFDVVAQLTRVRGQVSP